MTRLLDDTDPGVLAACASRDVPTLFRHLQDSGVRQRRIATLTGLKQPEVCLIVGGRRVTDYDRLVRIANGLGIPRGRMGLAYEQVTDGVAVAEGLLDDPDVVAACARRDIASLYRYLQACGFKQRRIATLTESNQSDVTEIVTGRRVPRTYDLFVRIANGLGIPRGRMGLAYIGSDAAW